MYPFIELGVVLTFAAGWLVLEYVGRRLDREKEARERDVQLLRETEAEPRNE